MPGRRAAVAALVAALLASAAPVLAHPTGKKPAPVLDGVRLKRFHWKGDGDTQVNLASAAAPATCGPPECLAQAFYVRPSAGVRGDVVFGIVSLRPAAIDLYVVDAVGRVVGQCAGPPSTSEYVVVPATAFRRTERYFMVVRFAASASDAFNATIEFPRAFRSELPAGGRQPGTTCAYDDLPLPG